MGKMPAKDELTAQRGELLVALLNDPAALAILRDQGWYRIPVAKAPKRWPPAWLAFYQTKVFGTEAYAVHYYGRVRHIRTIKRRDLFPNEFSNPKSDWDYYQLHLESLERLSTPIPSARWRRIVFIPTSWRKFAAAAEINDLFDDSPLEDRLWAEFKRLKIAAERQWELILTEGRYFLDFALFCRGGRLDVEADGDSYHAGKYNAEDRRRNNALGAAGWRVLRFNGREIRESLADYCVKEVAQAITNLGGLDDEGLVSRKFYTVPDGTAQQLALFEESAEYDLD